jgi:hypothetical protein
LGKDREWRRLHDEQPDDLFWWKTPLERDNLEDLGIDGGFLLKQILK